MSFNDLSNIINHLKSQGEMNFLWETIQSYYDSGGYFKVKQYIEKIAKEQDIQVLKDFLEKEEI